jgi:hypothetical protein
MDFTQFRFVKIDLYRVRVLKAWQIQGVRKVLKGELHCYYQYTSASPVQVEEAWR